MKGLQPQQEPESRDRYLWDKRRDETNKGQSVEQNEKKAKHNAGDTII